jgi:hypothetical protein
VWAIFGVSLALGCSAGKKANAVDPEKRDPVTGLTLIEAKEVLVTVGDKAITLGDYVATLQRMDRFERLRFQTEDRQKQLLDEIIQVELLAQEAVRRGLDKAPEAQKELQQALRDELLRQLESELLPAEKLSEREVREYYEAHRGEFQEPERRRVLALRVGSKSIGETVLREALGATGQKWGELGKRYSLDQRALAEGSSEELFGDLGFVAAQGVVRGDNDAVPESVRAFVFTLGKVGDVASSLAQEGESYFVVRLGGISPGRDRSVGEADRTIRVELRRQMFLKAEKKLEAELRQKYPVKIDEAAIAAYQKHVPAASPGQPGVAAPDSAPSDPAAP